MSGHIPLEPRNHTPYTPIYQQNFGGLEQIAYGNRALSAAACQRNPCCKVTEDQGYSGGTAAAGGSASLQGVAVERGAC